MEGEEGSRGQGKDPAGEKVQEEGRRATVSVCGCESHLTSPCP